jgi:hypothetical protein
MLTALSFTALSWTPRGDSAQELTARELTARELTTSRRSERQGMSRITTLVTITIHGLMRIALFPCC